MALLEVSASSSKSKSYHEAKADSQKRIEGAIHKAAVMHLPRLASGDTKILLSVKNFFIFLEIRPNFRIACKDIDGCTKHKTSSVFGGSLVHRHLFGDH